MREYEGRVPLVHVDVYRLDHVQELHDLGFDELVGEDAVTRRRVGRPRQRVARRVDRLDVLLDARRAATTTASSSVDAVGVAGATRRDASHAVDSARIDGDG